MAEPTVIRRGDRIEIGATVRVECGPPRVTATATQELLSDASTAEHYYAGERIVGGEKRIGRDALGKAIVVGEPMTYLDFRASPVFYVFQRRELSVEEREERGTSYEYIYEDKGSRDTEDGAVEFGKSLAAE